MKDRDRVNDHADEGRKNRQKAYSYALWLLGRRDYSRTKLRAKLQEKGYADFADSVLDELAEKEYLRENVYAEGRVRDWIRRGYSLSMIQRRARSESFEISAERVRELYEELGMDEATQIHHLLRKRLKRSKCTAENLKRKLAATAARKGHSFGAIQKVLERDFADLENSDGEAEREESWTGEDAEK